MTVIVLPPFIRVGRTHEFGVMFGCPYKGVQQVAFLVSTHI